MKVNDNTGRMRLGALLTLVAAALLAVPLLVRLRSFQDIQDMLSPLLYLVYPAQVLFIAGPALCWASTGQRTPRIGFALASSCAIFGSLLMLLGLLCRALGTGAEGGLWSRLFVASSGLPGWNVAALGLLCCSLIEWEGDRGHGRNSPFVLPMLLTFLGVVTGIVCVGTEVPFIHLFPLAGLSLLTLLRVPASPGRREEVAAELGLDPAEWSVSVEYPRKGIWATLSGDRYGSVTVLHKPAALERFNILDTADRQEALGIARRLVEAFRPR
jgi:hypothetical protein